jgi:Tfp pilus assembly protein PilO
MVGMLAFSLVGIFPNLSELRQRDEEIDALNHKVQAQEILHPIYIELIRQARENLPSDLPLPDAENVSGENIADINKLFSSMASQSGVIFESGIPDPSSYLESNQLIMNASFNGDFFNFRNLLMQISEMPYLINIRQIKIKTEGDMKRMALKLALRQKSP